MDMRMKDDALRASFLLKAKNSNLNLGSPNPNTRMVKVLEEEIIPLPPEVQDPEWFEWGW